MSDATALTVPPAGWYPDRNEANTSRWWDGQQWTEHTQTAAPANAAFEQPVSAAVFGFGANAHEPVALVEPVAAPEPANDAAIAGWYHDQWDPSLLRWWDGDRWTSHTCAADVAVGEVSVAIGG